MSKIILTANWKEHLAGEEVEIDDSLDYQFENNGAGIKVQEEAVKVEKKKKNVRR